MAETGLNNISREGIPSGLNRIKLKKEKRLSSDDSVHSVDLAASPSRGGGGGGGGGGGEGGVMSRLPPMGHRRKDSDGHWKIDGNKEGMSKGKKIARWFTSYLAKDSHHESIHGNKEVSGSEVKILNKEGFGITQQPTQKDLSQEIAGTRKLPLNFKSFSHELGPKGGLRPALPPTRAHSYNDLKEMLGSLRSRFDAAKEMVNSELATFAEDVEEVIAQQSFSPSARWQTVTDLLNLAKNCIEMTSSELREKCEGIVQDLAEKRQQCQAGLVKQLFTRMLFILTRCTRLLQFEKDSEPIDESSLHKFRQCLENIPAVEMNWVPKPEGTVVASKDNMKKRGNKRQMKRKNMAMAFTFPDRTWHRTEELPDESETSLENKSDALTQNPSSPKSQVNVQSGQSGITEFDSHNLNVPLQGNFLSSNQEDNLILCDHAGGVGSPGRLSPKPSNGLVYEQDRVSDDSDSVICRICEEVVPTSHLETHSYICAYADKCDLKGFDVDERLSKLADVLEQIIDSSTLSYNASCGSPDLSKVQTANSAVGSGCQSPKVIEWHNKGVEGMFEDLHEMDTACIDESHLLGTSNLKGLFGLKYNHFGATSSNGSLTSMSSTNTPRASHFDLFWLEHNNSSEPEDVQQMTELAEIAWQVSDVNLTSEAASEHLLEYMHNLQDILQKSKLKALVIDTFGSRIENLLREKYLLAFELMDNKNPRHASKHSMESLLASPSSVMSTPVHPTHKDRISIDDFVIIKPISKGAFGKVFLARKRTTGDLFAIKVLKKLDMIRKNDVERILAERNILITVRNPFVVRFFYSFTCRDNLYLVMEYLNGGDLYSLLRKVGCLEEDVARTYIAELVLALEYLHTLGIVHRDLKPDNILIAQDGHIKLLDFGLSKIGLINSTVDLSGPETDSTALTEADDLHPSFEHTTQREDRNQRSAVGTPDYLAPEILLGTEHGYAADWWSVGIILFELITGIPPFSAESPEIIFDNILNKKMPWPIVPDDMSHEAQDLINRFLIHDPDQRLGANGASEVKSHPFFAGVNWDTLALQKAAFVPHPDSAEDTSYFLSRYSQMSTEIPVPEDENFSECSSDSTASCSNSGLEMDECGDLTDFNSSPLNLSLLNFSFKNLSQLAKINYDVLLQRGPSNCSSPARGPDP